MDKIELTASSLGIIFFLALIIYSVTSSGFTMFLHLFLLISGFLISIFMINKVTKSSNSLKSKIYFSFVLSFLIFFSIIFFWFLGNHSSIDDKGLTTALIVIPSTIFFGVASFIIGIILSIKRKTRKDFDYSFKLFSSALTIISIILLFVFFFNFMISKSAIVLGSEGLCYMTLSPPNSGSYMFNADFEPSCVSQVGIAKNDETICKNIRDDSHKNRCYHWVTVNKKDIKICFNSPQPFDMSVRCGTAFSKLENEIYNILSNPSHPDITYAIKATPYLGIYYDESAENKFIPLIKNIVTQGSLEDKKEALEILFTWAGQNSFEEEKEVLRSEILLLIENQPELQEYVDRINARLSAVVLKPSTSTIKTE